MIDDAATDSQPDDPDEQTERYAAIETGSGETMIYDRENPDAWVQSSYTLEFGV